MFKMVLFQIIIGLVQLKPVTLNIDLDNDGTPEEHTYDLRIANKSTPTECSTQGFSQTACGFVLEFVQSVTTHAVNSSTTGSEME